MEQKITYIKDAFLHIRVDSVDLKRWKSQAKQCNVSLTAYVIKAINYVGGTHNENEVIRKARKRA